jgi:hypothetical protein
MGLLQTKEVLPILAKRGVPTQRESLAAMSDALGLRTRAERSHAAARRWSEEQVDMIVLAFRLRRGWNLDIADLKALLERGADAVDELAGEYRSTLVSFSTLGRAVLAVDAEAPVPDPAELPDVAALARRGAA